MSNEGTVARPTGEMYRGLAVSPGIVVARAYCLESVSPSFEDGALDPADVQRELQRFNQACDRAASELTGLIERVSHEIGEVESRIFQSHLYMLRDRAFISKVHSLIAEHRIPAGESLVRAVEEYEELFASIKDEYLRERIVDLRDVAQRIAGHLSEARNLDHLDLGEPVVLVAREMYPSQTLRFGGLKIAAIVTERGSHTSHAAIIARSLGLPAVSGIADVPNFIRTGDLVAVDGRDGLIIVNPGAEAEAAYRKLEREFVGLKNRLVENRDQPAITTDHVPIELLANINNVSDARLAVDVGAGGVGLFRTEYVFMTHPSIPDEEEQYQAYRQIIEASPGRQVLIRTLDLGGDKTVPYFPSWRETNPFMGWRSIRLSFAHPEFFQKQIRAILRAAVAGNVGLLLPMISTVEEIHQAQRLIDDVREQLEQEKIPFARGVPRGIMIEVPAAAVAIETMADHVDFVSIGSNDLVQYLMAADRDNPKVAHLCDPLNPAVLRVIAHVVDVCRRKNVRVSLCGEMAGRPRGVLAALALGLRAFSMSPAFIPLVKDLVRSVSLTHIESLRDRIFDCTALADVQQLLGQELTEVNPRLARMDIGTG